MSMPNLRPFRIVVSTLNVRSMNRFSTTFADARPRFREVLGFDLSPCLGEAVQQGSRVHVHLPTRRDERLSLREFLLEAGPEDSQTPIKTPCESRSRPSDLASFQGGLPF